MVRDIWKEHRWWIIPAIFAAIIMIVSIGTDRPAYGAEPTNIEKLFSILKSEASPVRLYGNGARIKASVIEQDGEQYLKLKFDECLYYGFWVPPKYARFFKCPYHAEIMYTIDQGGVLKEKYVNCLGAPEELEYKLRWYRKAYVSDAGAINELVVTLVRTLTKKTASQ